jgi:hypothetical protein
MRVRALLILAMMVLGVMLLSGMALAVATKAPGSASPRAVGPGDYLGQRSTGGSLSIECYTFYPDRTVELRHNGASAPTDSGHYQGDANGGEIVWNSGRVSSVVAQGDGSLLIDGLRVTPIEPGCRAV